MLEQEGKIIDVVHYKIYVCVFLWWLRYHIHEHIWGGGLPEVVRSWGACLGMSLLTQKRSIVCTMFET